MLIERRNLRAVKASLSVAVGQAKLLGSEPSLARAAIAVHVTRELYRSRERARAAARPIWKRQTGVLYTATPHEAIETERATAAGQSIARRWRLAESKLAQETPRGGGPYRTYTPAIEEAAPHVARAVVTETADAWNAELYEQGLAAMRAGFIVTFTWDTDPTSNVCHRCEALDGEQVVGEQRFSEGPPPLHPNCRCQISTSLARLH